MSVPTVRPLHFSDIKIVCDLLVSEGVEVTAEDLRDYYNPGFQTNGYAIDVGGVPVGFVLWSILGAYTTIDHLVVHPSYRRKGFGISLLRAVRHHPLLPHMKGIQAWVSEYNLPVQLFFKNAGFRWVRTSGVSDGEVRYLFQHLNQKPRGAGDKNREEAPDRRTTEVH